MKKIFRPYVIIGLIFTITSCNNKNKIPLPIAENLETNFSVHQTFDEKGPSQAFKNYWYTGEAEISSYALEQARYGEIRKGTAVLIYVTEDFSPNTQVKADKQSPTNISVLKLNATKKFNTGIYPYSIMQSTFYPVSNNQHAIKVSSSIQEWCGHVYTQLNNKEDFKITSHSYFEGEADQNFKLDKAILENELWAQLRINPKSLPTGHLKMIPAFEYLRLRHITLKAYKASANLTKDTYTIIYPELNRTLAIQFNENFPYNILAWEETFKSGFGTNAKTLTTKATKLKTLKSAYWNKNHNTNKALRQMLQLD